jgi:hypothetical protein
MSLITAGQLAFAYDMPCWDYQRDAAGLAVINGTGGLLTVMDHRPDLRWAVSVEGLRAPSRAVHEFFTAINHLGIRVAVYVIFMGLTDVQAVVHGLRPVENFVYCANAVLPGRRVELEALLCPTR